MTHIMDMRRINRRRNPSLAVPDCQPPQNTATLAAVFEQMRHDAQTMFGIKMKKEFEHNWNQVIGPLLAIPCVIAYILWKEGGSIDTPLAIFLCVIILGSLLKQAFPLCKITLSNREIHLAFLLPFRPSGSFLLEQIEGYREISISRKDKQIPICGLLQPVGQKRIMLLAGGTKNFGELSALLRKILPELKTNTDPGNREVRETPAEN